MPTKHSGAISAERLYLYNGKVNSYSEALENVFCCWKDLIVFLCLWWWQVVVVVIIVTTFCSKFNRKL